MAISKLSEVIPTTTMVEADADVPRKAARRRRKGAGRKKAAPRKKAASGTGPWPLLDHLWDERFEQFLEYCGWIRDPASDMPEYLKHPKDEVWFSDGEFMDAEYDTLIDAIVSKDSADTWMADDKNFVLYKEVSLAKKNKARWRLEIKLK